MARTLPRWITDNAGDIASRAGICLLLAGIITGFHAMNLSEANLLLLLLALLPTFLMWFAVFCVVAALISWSVAQNAFKGAVDRFGKKFAKHI